MGRMGIVLVIIIFLLANCKEYGENKERIAIENTMSKNFDIYITQGWNRKNMDSLRSISVENYSRELNGIKVAENQNELEANLNIYFTGFPDAEITIDHCTIKNNRLFTQWTFEGTNTGIFGESRATGKHVIVSGYSEFTFDPIGKISIEKTYYNELAFVQQMGYTLIPPIVD